MCFSDFDGEVPFCLSLRKKHTDISLYLLSKGCPMDCLDPVTSKSLLATAVMQGSLAVGTQATRSTSA